MTTVAGESNKAEVEKVYGLFSLTEEELLELAKKYGLAKNLKSAKSKIEKIVALLISVRDKNLLDQFLNDVPSVQQMPKEMETDWKDILLAINKYQSPKIVSSDMYLERNRNTAANALALQGEINTLRSQIEDLQKQKPDEQNASIKKIEKSIATAAEKSADLTANIILPPRSMTDVHLVPTHSLERFVEYKADENIAFLLTGTFSGAAISILVNWATNDTFEPNAMSTTLLILFITLAILSIAWIVRIHLRVKSVSEIFQKNDDK